MLGLGLGSGLWLGLGLVGLGLGLELRYVKTKLRKDVKTKVKDKDIPLYRIFSFYLSNTNSFNQKQIPLRLYQLIYCPGLVNWCVFCVQHFILF